MTQAELMPLPHRPRPFGDVVKSADLSDDGLFRWSLTRCWGKGAYVCWIMLNPSSADAVQDDPTIRRCMAWSRRWGYGGLKVVNVWPYRTSSPAELRRWLKVNGQAHEFRLYGQNTKVIEATAKDAGLVIAAWGTNGGVRSDEIASGLGFDGVDLHCLGHSMDGYPIHPMARGKYRVPDNVDLKRFYAPEGYS